MCPLVCPRQPGARSSAPPPGHRRPASMPACSVARSPGRPFTRSPACPPPTRLPQHAQKASSQSELPFSRALTLACPMRPAPAMVPPSAFPPEFTRAHVRPPACPLSVPAPARKKIEWSCSWKKKGRCGGTQYAAGGRCGGGGSGAQQYCHPIAVVYVVCRGRSSRRPSMARRRRSLTAAINTPDVQ